MSRCIPFNYHARIFYLNSQVSALQATWIPLRFLVFLLVWIQELIEFSPLLLIPDVGHWKRGRKTPRTKRTIGSEWNHTQGVFVLSRIPSKRKGRVSLYKNLNVNCLRQQPLTWCHSEALLIIVSVMETVWLELVYCLDSSLMQLSWGGGAEEREVGNAVSFSSLQ